MAVTVGHTFDYDFGQKRHWRRWMWNRIAERVPSERKRSGVVIYLPGPSDEDRKIALSRGFAPHALIGVERNGDTRDRLRKAQSLVVGGDFITAVDHVAANRDVDVVYGDFCGDIDRSIISALVRWIGTPTLASTVFAFNFQRGRGTEVRACREMFSMVPAFQELLQVKERGPILLATVIFTFVAGMKEGVLGECAGDIAADLIDSCAAETWSYKTVSGNVFDSIVLSSPILSAGLCWDDASVLMKHFRDRIKKRASCDSKAARTVASARAVLAHRSIRMRGVA
jgi:hypothetical protein